MRNDCPIGDVCQDVAPDHGIEVVVQSGGSEVALNERHMRQPGLGTPLARDRQNGGIGVDADHRARRTDEAGG